MKRNLNQSILKKFGLTGIGLCALLCSLPIIGTVLGIAALSRAAIYLENIGILILILSMGALALWFIKRKKDSTTTPSCNIDCGCKTESSISSKL